VRAPTANAFCERLGGSLRRECLDFLIPLNERHLRMIVKEWVVHDNRGRPHSSLGPGIPEPSQERVPASDHRHKLPAGYRVGKTPLAAYITSIAWSKRLLKRRCRARTEFSRTTPGHTLIASVEVRQIEPPADRLEQGSSKATPMPFSEPIRQHSSTSWTHSSRRAFQPSKDGL
jgi:hypothetical protein